MAHLSDLVQQLAGPKQNLLAAALAQNPGLRAASNAAFVQRPASTASPGMLEFYPPRESDNPVPGRPTVAAFGNRATPTDVAGDLVSHYLARGVDPALTANYKSFVRSLTPQQAGTLHEQYQWSQQHEGERRPFQTWAAMSGIPAYFRGYAFSQWPSSFTSQAYTPPQIALSNQMLGYLATGKPQPIPADSARTALQTALSRR